MYHKERDKGAEAVSENSTPSCSTDSSLTLSPMLLPEGNNKRSHQEDRPVSAGSSISEHLSSVNSIENDRSLHEVEISNIALHHTSQTNLSEENNPSSPPSDPITNSTSQNIRDLLQEIIFGFRSESEKLKSDSCDSIEASLNIFEAFSLGDGSIKEYLNKGSEQKQVISNQSTVSAEEMDTLTEYKDQNEVDKIEFETALKQRELVIKDLMDTLEMKISKEKEQDVICENYKKEIDNLRDDIKKMYEQFQSQSGEVKRDSLSGAQGEMCKELESTLQPHQINLLREILLEIKKTNGRQLEDEIRIVKENHETEKDEYVGEVKKLRELLGNVKSGSVDVRTMKEELDAKHLKEMEELRMYYEKKCADMEKNYSDEIFSQHSRKLSNCSTGSEPELASDLIYAGGDAGKELVCAKGNLFELKRQLDRASEALSKYDLITISAQDYDGIRDEIDKLIALLKLDCEGRMKAYEERCESLQKELDETTRATITTVQEPNGDDELGYVVKSYEIRVKEQTALAVNDFMSNLTHQIEVLSADPVGAVWPDELLGIKTKFTEKYEAEIDELKTAHDEEISKLKEEHIRMFNGAMERARRRSLRDSDDADVVKERNTLKKSTANLKKTVIDLLVYCSQCEHELNSTLVDKITQLGDINLDDSATSSTSKRVRITPDLSGVLDRTDDESISEVLESVLSGCLERLASDANEVLVLSQIKKKDDDESEESLDKRVADLTRKIYDLTKELKEIKELNSRLESERGDLETRLDQVLAKNNVLEMDLVKAKGKIAELVESNRKEVVSEGYGENEKLGTRRSVMEHSLPELQEKARALAMELSTKEDSPLWQLVEDLCRVGDKLLEEAKTQREDFLQQMEAANKKLRERNQFLDEQAAEREQERDEAQRNIEDLRTQLRDKETDLLAYERTCQEDQGTDTMNICCKRIYDNLIPTVEHLDLQMREITKHLHHEEIQHAIVEREKNEAVEKVHGLREIIVHLETQLKEKETSELELSDAYKKLVEQHRETNESLALLLEQREDSKNQQIQQLEEEIEKLRVTNELAGNKSVLNHIQHQLHEFELGVDRGIRDLECVQLASTTCSSPSEEMSARDQIRPQTPTSTADDCDIPLQQLARLKEKLIRHTRAEQMAVKRIQDLDMQFNSLKADFDEVHNEKNILQEQFSEQLVLISSLQIRLDDQRIQADQSQKQTNSKLEMRIHELETEIQHLMDTLHSKESTIKQLKKIIEETRQRLHDRESEISDDDVLTDLQQQMNKLKSENDLLRAKIESDAQNNQLLPNLVDNIIADKNRDIEILKIKLSDTEKQLELYATINSEKMNKSDVYVDPMRKAESRCASLELSAETTNFHLAPELSSIERIGPSNINYTVEAPLSKPNSTEIQKRVHFEDQLKSVKEESMRQENELRLQLNEITSALEVLEKDKALLAEDNKRKDDMYYRLAKEKKDNEKALQEEIVAFKTKLGDKDKGINELIREIESIKVLKHDKEAAILDIEKNNDALKALQAEKDNELKVLLSEKQKLCEDLKTLKQDKSEMLGKCKRLSESSEALTKAHKSLKEDLHKRSDEIKRLNDLLYDRECELEVLQEAANRYQRELSKYESERKNDTQLKSMKQRKEMAQKDLEIVKMRTNIADLQNEITHLQDYLREKDKIIHQMQTDSESLKVNLMTIKEKMKESGNILDLRQKLEEQREINENLRAVLGSNDMDELTDQVQKQLDYSAELDLSILNALNSFDYTQINDSEQLKAIIASQCAGKEKFQAYVKTLEEKLAINAATLSKVESILEEERKRATQMQAEGANVFEQMRQSLEVAKAKEHEMAEFIKEEQIKRSVLEVELNALKKSENGSSASGPTQYYSLPDGVQLLKKENQKMKKELKALNKLVVETQDNLKFTKNVLNMKCKEIEKLEKEVKRCNEEVLNMQQQYKSTKEDLDQKNKEIENSRQLLAELEDEKQESKEENDRLNLVIQNLSEEMKNRVDFETNKKIELSSKVSDEFMAKMGELGDQVNTYMRENQTMTKTLNVLTDERTQLQSKLRELESQQTIHFPFNDPVGRANHLFGKYLRSESYRKALQFQKLYLKNLLETYQGSQYTPKYPRQRSSTTKGIQRFKVACYAVISIYRMQYLVRRWRSGFRSGTYISPQQWRPQNVPDETSLQNIPVQPRLQKFSVEPRLQNFSVGPRIQNISVEPRLQNFSVEPRLQNFSVEPRLQNFSVEPRLQNFSVEPRLQNMSVESRLQNISIEPRLQNISVEPRLQNISIEPKLQKISDESRLQNISVDHTPLNESYEEVMHEGTTFVQPLRVQESFHARPRHWTPSWSGRSPPSKEPKAGKSSARDESVSGVRTGSLESFMERFDLIQQKMQLTVEPQDS